MSKQKLKVVGPQNYTDSHGDIEHENVYGIVSTDGTEFWDVEYPFDTKESAELRMTEIEKESQDDR